MYSDPDPSRPGYDKHGKKYKRWYDEAFVKSSVKKRRSLRDSTQPSGGLIGRKGYLIFLGLFAATIVGTTIIANKEQFDGNRNSDSLSEEEKRALIENEARQNELKKNEPTKKSEQEEVHPTLKRYQNVPMIKDKKVEQNQDSTNNKTSSVDIELDNNPALDFEFKNDDVIAQGVDIGKGILFVDIKLSQNKVDMGIGSDGASVKQAPSLQSPAV